MANVQKKVNFLHQKFGDYNTSVQWNGKFVAINIWSAQWNGKTRAQNMKAAQLNDTAALNTRSTLWNGTIISTPLSRKHF